eukprot:TRINITY_DN15399_c0_g1_i1.p1 TRINITY_DN15399_c0_g1~~TRINITY_DN15399_c0_g1_i1.p1  ORF type:complete len:149 (+),score=24.22 TRINITY_DN15399_c0_g1_i1:5-451(+)
MTLDPASLLGQSPTSAAFTQFTSQHTTCTADVAKFRDCEYHTYKPDGLSFCFDIIGADNAVLTLGGIHVFNGVQGYIACKLALPHGVHLRMTNVDVVTLLGEPTKKGGGRSMPVFIVYERVGLQVDFQSASWEDLANPIVSLTYFSVE